MEGQLGWDRSSTNRAMCAPVGAEPGNSHVRRRAGLHQSESSEGFIFRRGQHVGDIVQAAGKASP